MTNICSIKFCLLLFLHLIVYLTCRCIESMNIVSKDDGTYAVSWVPSTAGTYNIKICIDGSWAGILIHVYYTVHIL